MSGRIGAMPKVLISDKHIGTTLWQRAMILDTDAEVIATTLSSHAHYAPRGTIRKSWFTRQLGRWPRWLIRLWAGLSPSFRDVTHALCSFPPSRLLALENLPARIRIIVNAGHRFHIHLTGKSLVDFTRRFAELGQNPRFVLATMSEYDFHYIKYYTGLDVERLPVVAMHAPAVLRLRDFSPSSRTVLVGPSHNDGQLLGLFTLDDLNERSAAFASRLTVDPFRFEFIKSIYPGDSATFENLSRHPAALILPYSAFSISMVEIYQLNIPFIVPSDRLLVDKLRDVRLSPIYCDQSEVEELDRRFSAVGRQRGYAFSPNDDSAEAQRLWMQFMYFNQVENCLRFETAGELITKLYETDLKVLSSRMREENLKLEQRQREAWRRIMGGIHSS